VGARIAFTGRLCFSTTAKLNEAKAHLVAPERSLFAIEPGALREHHLMLELDVAMSAPASIYHETNGALLRVLAMGDARGHVDRDFEGDETERLLYDRRIDRPAPHRAESPWWARIQPVHTGVVQVIYTLPEEDDHVSPDSPSFVLGPMPEGTLRGSGLIRELEAILNAALPTSGELAETLQSALAWAHHRPDDSFLFARELAAVAGLGRAHA